METIARTPLVDAIHTTSNKYHLPHCLEPCFISSIEYTSLLLVLIDFARWSPLLVSHSTVRPFGHVIALKARIGPETPMRRTCNSFAQASGYSYHHTGIPNITISNSTIGLRKVRHYQSLWYISVNNLVENGGLGIAFGCGDTIATKYTSEEVKHNIGHEPSL